MMNFVYPKKPCAECPWRMDVPTGRFPAIRFEDLAGTAHDMSARVFACHKSREGADAVCAGFLLQGTAHNFTIRRALSEGTLNIAVLTDGGYPLYPTYRAMAVANGVGSNSPSLQHCRDDAQRT